MFGRKTHEEHGDTVAHSDTAPVYTETPKERYGGFTFSGAFFGWLVASGGGAASTASGSAAGIAKQRCQVSQRGYRGTRGRYDACVTSSIP